jgi:SAM-dependent methyltransferase
MSLDQKYDAFYRQGGNSNSHSEIAVGRWPVDRMQAIVFVPAQGKTVLDIGCGDGWLLYQFRNRFSHLVGLEYSQGRLDVAHAKLKGLAFTGVCGSAENMHSIESNSIDHIVCADVIEHIPDVYQAADEMFRVLRPGGHAVINTPNIAFVKKRLRLLAGRFPSTSQPNEGHGSDILYDGGHLHYFTYRSLRVLLQRSGFSVVREMGFGPLGKLHDVWRTGFSVAVQLVVVKPKP